MILQCEKVIIHAANRSSEKGGAGDERTRLHLFQDNVPWLPSIIFVFVCQRVRKDCN